MPCIRCGKDFDGPAANCLGYCGPCHKNLISDIRGKAANIPNNLCHWIGKTENAYGNKMFYTEDIDKHKVNLALDSEKGEYHRGTARGFSAVSKNFTLLQGFKPSESIRNFIEGPTVCECECATQGVIYNALLDVYGLPTIDLIFANLTLKQGKSFDDFMKRVTIRSETQVQKGDWVYIFCAEAGMFRELAFQNGENASATGWNLICVEAGPTPKYLGFGLTPFGKTEVTTVESMAMTLNDVRKQMVPTRWFEKSGKPTSSAKKFHFDFMGSLPPQKKYADYDSPANATSATDATVAAEKVRASIKLLWRGRFDVDLIVNTAIAALQPH